MGKEEYLLLRQGARPVVASGFAEPAPGKKNGEGACKRRPF
jgi:hypothetical protein